MIAEGDGVLGEFFRWLNLKGNFDFVRGFRRIGKLVKDVQTPATVAFTETPYGNVPAPPS